MAVDMMLLSRAVLLLMAKFLMTKWCRSGVVYDWAAQTQYKYNLVQHLHEELEG